MGDDMYLTTYEASLALVATSMKKARLRIPLLVVNSLMGGVFFTAGGMFRIMLIAHLPTIYASDPGIILILEGTVCPIGLFFVVIMGSELFNSNILFFSVGLVRGAVSIVDVLVSWLVSWWLNLVGTIFVAYIICFYSDIYASPEMVQGSIDTLDLKASYQFHQTLIKGIAGNFFVVMAIYLQLMVKPLHVKFFMLFLPVFLFVSLGFTHSVADMFLVVIGLINGSKVSVATVAWKILLPGAIGNIIGGAFFGIAVPWYSHMYLVEYDQKSLQLPQYELRDEQPQINMDSRVVRQRDNNEQEEENEVDEEILDDIESLKRNKTKESNVQKTPEKLESTNSSESNSLSAYQPSPPRAIYDSGEEIGSRLSTVATGASIRSNRSLTRTRSRARTFGRSPKNVFPVYGMGEPLERERSIATGYYDAPDITDLEDNDDFEENKGTSAEYMGARVRNFLSRKFLKTSQSDIEDQRHETASIDSHRPSYHSADSGSQDINRIYNPTGSGIQDINRPIYNSTGSGGQIVDPMYNPNPRSPVESLTGSSPTNLAALAPISLPPPAKPPTVGSQKSVGSEKNSYNNRKATAAIPTTRNNDKSAPDGEKPPNGAPAVTVSRTTSQTSNSSQASTDKDTKNDDNTPSV